MKRQDLPRAGAGVVAAVDDAATHVGQGTVVAEAADADGRVVIEVSGVERPARRRWRRRSVRHDGLRPAGIDLMLAGSLAEHKRVGSAVLDFSKPNLARLQTPGDVGPA